MALFTSKCPCSASRLWLSKTCWMLMRHNTYIVFVPFTFGLTSVCMCRATSLLPHLPCIPAQTSTSTQEFLWSSRNLSGWNKAVMLHFLSFLLWLCCSTTMSWSSYFTRILHIQAQHWHRDLGLSEDPTVGTGCLAYKTEVMPVMSELQH